MDDATITREAFASFADHLVPEAFATPTRAHRVTHEAAGPMDTGRPESRARFDRWVEARIEDALAASWPHDRPLVVAFTSDGRLLRRYDENGCGHLDCVVALVQNEVTAIDTPWVLGAALPRPQRYWEVVFDEGGNSRVPPHAVRPSGASPPPTASEEPSSIMSRARSGEGGPL